MSEKKETPNAENAEPVEEQAQAKQAEGQEQPEPKEQAEVQKQPDEQAPFEEQEPPEQAVEQTPSEQEEHPEHHPVKQSSGSSAAFLATIIALAAIGASYYLWQQQQGLRKDVATLDNSVNRLVDVVDVVAQHNTQQSARIEELSRHNHPKVEQKLVQVEQGLLELRSRLGQKRSAWVISEAEYLVRIASHRLTLERDTLTAAAALSEAANRLHQLKDPSLNPLIAHINNDVATVKNISLPDRDVMASRLAQIASEIPQWPFATGDHQAKPESAQAESETAPGEPQPPTQSGWKQTLAKMWEDIKSLVTIRHNDEVNKPVTDTGQRFFLQQNLRLKFESARLALLSGQTTAYHGSLREARNWIQRYFDTSNPSVAGALASLQQLDSIELNQPLPSLNDTLILLQKAALAAQPASELSSLPDIKQPAPTAAQPGASESQPAQESAPPTEQPPAEVPAPDSSENSPEKTPPASDVPSVPQGVAL